MLTTSMIVLLLFRVLALRGNATDLFFDEAQYWSWSLEPAFGYYSKPPLIAWVIRLSTETCGLSEFCIRLPSPVFHTATAFVIFAAANRLYDARTGFWAALAFATLPGVSFSAGIISTDVPLLFAWGLALWAYVALAQGRSWFPVLVLGIALGIGLNAKYAMAYFALCVAVDMVATPDRRHLLRDPRLWSALAIGMTLIAPNLIWNASNKFATFSHTADNAKWTGSLIHPLKALEFFASQFGVFGPILFAGLLVIVVRAYRQGVPSADRLLLAFALPVLIVVTVQAFLSRAHANWAAVSYVAAVILVVATMIRDLSWTWLRTSLALHLALLVGMALAAASAGQIKLPGLDDPFARTLGWREVAAETRSLLAEARKAGKPFAAVITDERALSAELLYYMRDEPTPVLAWRTAAKPADHYELTRPFTAATTGRVLLVAMRRDTAPITGRFASTTRLAAKSLAAGRNSTRAYSFHAVEGFSGP
ncbi:MAG: glycosyltransferase family 39 protein [Hyphomicrobiaceae bacterium]